MSFIENRRKILFVSEASFAATGFGTIYKELISRFHADGRFRVAEFATDCYVDDDRDGEILWRLYPNSVLKNDPRMKDFSAHKNNSFGQWRFEEVLCDFEPDIVIDLRDPPFFHFESMSPLRPYFHWCVGPTVDSAPQPPDWISMFLGADSVMPYTDFGYDTLKKEHSEIKAHKGYGPGINLETFQPRPQAQIRRQFNIDPKIKLVGFVSRNQIRKRFPELLKSFSRFLEESGRDDIYLHLHTPTPDLKGWNTPKLLIENNLADKVMFTYMCLDCASVFFSPWQGSCTNCVNCSKKRAVHPRSGLGCDQSVMSKIYNCYDFYIQYSNCEGLGVGVLEAAASGIPFAAVDYSAMNYLNKKLGGAPIKYSLSRDIATDAERAIPDEDDTVRVLKEWLLKPKQMLARAGFNTRQMCEKNFNWDKIAAKWIEFCDNIELKDTQGCWGEEKCVDEEFFMEDSIVRDIQKGLQAAGRGDLMYSSYLLELYERNKNYRVGIFDNTLSPDEIDKIVANLDAENKIWSDINSGKKIQMQQDFIAYADQKEVSGIRQKIKRESK